MADPEPHDPPTVLERLQDPTDGFNIVPTPAPDAVRGSTIDLRVGRIFLSLRRSATGFVDASNLRSGSLSYDEARIMGEGDFVMQPRQFVLASTYEYLCMPKDL